MKAALIFTGSGPIVVLTTHESHERAMHSTLRDLARLASVMEPPVLLRIGDFND